MKRLKYVLFMIVLTLASVSFPVGAMPLVQDFYRLLGRFGSIVTDGNGGTEYGYLDTRLQVESNGDEVPAVSDGELLFVQTPGSLVSRLPAAAGTFIALAHDDGIVSITSGDGFSVSREELRTSFIQGGMIGRVARMAGSSKAVYFLQFFDGYKDVWINPLLFSPAIEDRGLPIIGGLRLYGQKSSITYVPTSKVRTRIGQGRYRIALEVEDLVRTNSVSGVFGFKVLLDGQIVVDKKLDTARITEGGLSFLGNSAPASSMLVGGGMLVIGEFDVVRGHHTLNVSVSDFSGNQTGLTWLLSGE